MKIIIVCSFLAFFLYVLKEMLKENGVEIKVDKIFIALMTPMILVASMVYVPLAAIKSFYEKGL